MKGRILGLVVLFFCILALLVVMIGCAPAASPEIQRSPETAKIVDINDLSVITVITIYVPKSWGKVVDTFVSRPAYLFTFKSGDVFLYQHGRFKKNVHFKFVPK